ncbi:hypothetical protein K7472_06680 [Streptomyces sp. PTM05]|uniref:CDP-glycerol:poly(Glycerophosphate) glycerophosphotransferase n=1 Tax=Streptantibioticus parmotrematis TaxID=2873249 RepID=A0ABS7QMW6_9ACTN|nr:hypothetical protein [Streptantibioticus parmotrematis]MBY8884528.1 hypothetical protein [Streptantibioticus parmotrematis]
MNLVPDGDWRQVPVRLDAARWATRLVCRKVLVVVHTVTTGQRLLDVVRLLEGDLRVQVVFTMVPDVFSNGVPDFLARLRAVVVPWRQAVETRFDLALASGHEGIHELHAPVVVLPHGAGHNKLVADGRRARTTADRGVYGLSRQWLVRDGAVVPDTIVLAHREEAARLARGCPEALPAAAVVGDPCYDSISVTLPLRALYRRALRTDSHQRLVVVSSTWGPRSLLAQSPDLLDRLVEELPAEQYRIAVLLHPNVWNAHGEWQIRAWFATLCRAGVALVSQDADWCGVLVAADHVISDHGSAALYGTAAGAPVLMANFPDIDLDPDSPMAELGAVAPRLRADRPVAGQLARSGSAQRRAAYTRVAARITSHPGRFARNMRALLYRKLRLRPAKGCRPVALPARLPVLVSECRSESAGPQ